MTEVTPQTEQLHPPGLTDLLNKLVRSMLVGLNCVKIGVVQSFDEAKQEVTVQIAQQQVTAISPTGVRTIAEYPLLLSVPVYFTAGGGFTLTFPIAKGDECIVLFNDRDLDSWLLSGAGQPPSSLRVHDIADGIALVGLRNNTRTLSAVSTTSAQLRSDDGDTYVEVAGGGVVSVVAPTSINLTAPEVNITASTSVTVTTPEETISGILTIQNAGGSGAPMTVTGDIHTSGDVIASGKSLVHHVHSGVTAGGANTGQPV